MIDLSNDETCFCWCFWNIDISIKELAQATDLVVRAMDESMNIQPRDMYWNVLSMLNNCWHRLTISTEENDSSLKFDHPTIAGITSGGWMERIKAEGKNLLDGFWGSSVATELKPSIDVKMTDDSITRIITEEELVVHNKNGDTWFALNGHVYDPSQFLREHPGGADSIISASGKDASEEFLAIHSDVAKSMLRKYHIGILPSANREKIDVFLNPKQWSKTMLKTKQKVNDDTFHLIFQLDHPEQKLGVPIGKHLRLQCISSSGEKVIRPYTPISDVDQLGQFELIIKVYRGCEGQVAGKMSQCIERLKEGDYVQCKGPFGDIEYQRNQIFLTKGEARKVEKLTMIAGGSGITPIYQVFRYAFEDGIDCDLIYCNKTEADILLKDKLENMKQIRHCLSRSNENWQGYRGYISRELLGEEHGGLLLCCGPLGMENLVREIAEESGWDISMQFIRF